MLTFHEHILDLLECGPHACFTNLSLNIKIGPIFKMDGIFSNRGTLELPTFSRDTFIGVVPIPSLGQICRHNIWGKKDMTR